MRFVITGLIILFFTGCAISKVPYNSDTDDEKLEKQYFEYNKCTYLVGPFNISDALVVDDIVKEAIEEANDNGLNGDSMINVQVKEGGYTVLLFSKLCLYVSGNIVYEDESIF